MKPYEQARKMRLHPITLAFTGHHRHLEPPFVSHYYAGIQRQMRIGAVVAALMCGLFGINDYYLLPGTFALYGVIRLAVMVPVCLMVLAIACSKYYLKLIQPAIWMATQTIGLAATVITVRAPADHFFVYFLGFVQILFFLYAFVRIRFLWATAATWLLLLAFLIGVLHFSSLTAGQAWGAFMGLVGINIMGMFASYAMEYSTRKAYFLSRELETKERRLAVSNQFLEERVSRRTMELTHVNEKLEKEIHERKAIAKDLINSKSRYRRMVHNVSDYICVHDARGLIVEANHRMVSGLGYAADQLIGHNLKEFMADKDHGAFNRYLEHVYQEGKDQGVLTLIRRDGGTRLLKYSNVLSQHDSDEAAVYCLARDITDRRQAELALAESKARFKDIFETASAGMMIVNDETQTVVEINPAAAQMVGRPAEKIKGVPIDHLMRPVAHDPHAHDTDRPPASINDDPDEWELLSELDGSIPVLKTMRPIEFDGQDHWIISISSLQKIKEAENIKSEMKIQLMQSQHLQAIGTLAGGIAHDFNNILFGVLGYAQLAMDDAPDGTMLKSNLGEIVKGGQRARDLISQILTFSRQGGAERCLLDPKPLIKEALKLLRASIPTTVEIQANIRSQAPVIHANTTQFHQVIMNLCTNAAQAMQDQGGLLQISMDHAVVDVEEKASIGNLYPGNYLRLRVSDTGVGMDPETVNRIFEPFFTTKPQGQGTGMGLSMVLGIIQDHKGAIRVDSRPGEGTRFDVLMPAAEAESQTEVEVETMPQVGTEHILFVDDEFSLIQMGRQMLSRLGYKVHAFQHALEALEFFQVNPHLIDLVITDLTMPKIIGTDLARAINQIRPDLPIILCSGNADTLEADTLESMGIRELISKPILRNDLALTIRRVLASAEAAQPSSIQQTG